MNRRSRSALRSTNRRGAAAVEFAVCLPILVMLIFGSIEASAMIFLKQSLNVAAYEASREAIRDGRSNADARVKANAILASRGVVGFNITFPNGESFSAVRGDQIAAEVTAPSGPNSPLVGQFIRNRILNARVVMVKQ